MDTLFDKICIVVAAGRYAISQHAAERLDERLILEWQVVDGIDIGLLLVERPDDPPNPSIEVAQRLADGTGIKVIWSHVQSDDFAKLVTVRYFD